MLVCLLVCLFFSNRLDWPHAATVDDELFVHAIMLMRVYVCVSVFLFNRFPTTVCKLTYD